jgi:phosphoribosyl 1,2-cyclic phosphate phosphodiesterase
VLFRSTILGCSSSGGVPRPAYGWGACDPANPKNRRRRCSILVERIAPEGRTVVLVDTSPDLREQLIAAGVQRLDGVLYTHDHADHTHGIDDIRPVVLQMRRLADVHADEHTSATLMRRFGYIFESPPDSGYPPIARLWRLPEGHPLIVEGPGGPVQALAIPVEHGPGYRSLGFRFDGLAYVPDVSRIPDGSKELLAGLDVLIIDALRYKPHPTHFCVADALAAIAELKPRRAVLTNLHTDLDFARLSSELPRNIEAAFDGWRFEL